MVRTAICDPFAIDRPSDHRQTAHIIRAAIKAKLLEIGVCGEDQKYNQWHYRLEPGTKINKAVCDLGEYVTDAWVEVTGGTCGFDYGFASGQIVIDLYWLTPDPENKVC